MRFACVLDTYVTSRDHSHLFLRFDIHAHAIIHMHAVAIAARRRCSDTKSDQARKGCTLHSHIRRRDRSPITRQRLVVYSNFTEHVVRLYSNDELRSIVDGKSHKSIPFISVLPKPKNHARNRPTKYLGNYSHQRWWKWPFCASCTGKVRTAEQPNMVFPTKMHTK